MALLQWLRLRRLFGFKASLENSSRASARVAYANSIASSNTLFEGTPFAVPHLATSPTHVSWSLGQEHCESRGGRSLSELCLEAGAFSVRATRLRACASRTKLALRLT